MFSAIKNVIHDCTNRPRKQDDAEKDDKDGLLKSDDARDQAASEKAEKPADDDRAVDEKAAVDHGESDTEYSEHYRKALDLGTDGYRTYAPYLSKPSSAERLWFFKQCADLKRGTHNDLEESRANLLPFRCFGDKGDVEDITEADIISTVEFDQTGNYLATGDKGGRVVLFERNETKKTCEYKFHTEFQSHEPEFDYLKSLEIEEKINKIKWCRRQNASHYLLSTNDKTIKLWKVFEKSLKVVAENNLSSELTPAGNGTANGGGPVRYPNQHFRSVADLKFPRMTHHDTVVAAVPRRVYANAHAYHINSISVNSDGETFVSSDDLRINLWNLNIQDQSFNIVDIKPANMEELTEVITAAEFHPISCNWFMYASSKGTIKLADMRQKALCDEHAKRKPPHSSCPS